MGETRMKRGGAGGRRGLSGAGEGQLGGEKQMLKTEMGIQRGERWMQRGRNGKRWSEMEEDRYKKPRRREPERRGEAAAGTEKEEAGETGRESSYPPGFFKHRM